MRFDRVAWLYVYRTGSAHRSRSWLLRMTSWMLLCKCTPSFVTTFDLSFCFSPHFLVVGFVLLSYKLIRLLLFSVVLAAAQLIWTIHQMLIAATWWSRWRLNELRVRRPKKVDHIHLLLRPSKSHLHVPTGIQFEGWSEKKIVHKLTLLVKIWKFKIHNFLL